MGAITPQQPYGPRNINESVRWNNRPSGKNLRMDPTQGALSKLNTEIRYLQSLIKALKADKVKCKTSQVPDWDSEKEQDYRNTMKVYNHQMSSARKSWANIFKNLSAQQRRKVKKHSSGSYPMS